MNTAMQVQRAMIAYFDSDVRRISHFLKVYGYARLMGEWEELDAQTQQTLEIAALTHDIGIKVSEQKYHSASGEYQQQEGPAEARKLLSALPVDPATIERVCWLIAHHHTYANMQGADYQLLVEADFLVNIDEDHLSPHAVDQIEHSIFRSGAGMALLRMLYPAADA